METQLFQPVKWKKITAENLDLKYGILMNRKSADDFMTELENTVEYFTGDLAKVKVFGKWHQIPRKQVAYGDPGLTYKFSGLKVPALPWPNSILLLRDKLVDVTGYKFDFVLVNRYKDGMDHIGEHRDDEVELDPNAPIASISLGQQRTFVLRHGDCRKKGKEKRKILPVKIELAHGSILMMNPPTNKFWYHSLPTKKSCMGPRINLTFRKHTRSNYK